LRGFLRMRGETAKPWCMPVCMPTPFEVHGRNVSGDLRGGAEFPQNPLVDKWWMFL